MHKYQKKNKGHTFDFDMRDLSQARVGARRLKTCDIPPNIFCAPCTRPIDPVLDVTAQTVYDDQV